MKGLSKWVVLSFLAFLVVLAGNGLVFAVEIGYTIYSSDSSFENSGEISASETVGDDTSTVVIGVYGEPSDTPLDSFENTENGIISATATAGNASGENSSVFVGVPGAYFDNSPVETFTNTGSISSEATAGEVSGENSSVFVGASGAYFVYSPVTTFTNTGSISSEATAGEVSGENSSVFVGASGAYFVYSPVTTFTNTGSISGTATAGDASGDYSRLEVYAPGAYFEGSSVDTFKNTGSILATATAGNASGENSSVDVEASGAYFDNDSSVTTFTNTNTGSISATATAGDAIGDYSNVSVYAYGAYFEGLFDELSVETFENTGSISATATAGNAESSVVESLAYGVHIYERDVTTFENTGSISATATAGDVSWNDPYVDYVDAMASGAYFGAHWDASLSVDTFTNTGSISATATAGNAIGAYSSVDIRASGADFDSSSFDSSSVGTFTNTGSISATATAGNAIGENSCVDVGAAGAYFGFSSVGTFTNTGSISATVTVGNASGVDSSVDIWASFGADFDFSSVETFANTGSISAAVTAGDASGENSTVKIFGVAGVYFGDGGNVDALNRGNISTTLKAGKNAEISLVAGLGVKNVSSAKIVNEGEISLKIDAPQAKPVTEAAGIYIMNSTARISNPGYIYLWNNAPGADIRTLRIEGSNVTLSNKFSIVFGQPGIDKRPIYVDDDSTLKLNDTNLIARVGSDFKFNDPYYLIENNGGTVDGVFGSLIKEYTNENIAVSWYDEERGENAAVVFGYTPKNSVSALGMHTSNAIASAIMKKVVTNREFGLIGAEILTADAGRILYAQAGHIATDVKASGREIYRNTFFMYPFYSYVDANDLGYDAKAGGFVLGFNRDFGTGFNLGVFGAYGKADLDYSIKGSDGGDQNIYSLSLYLDWKPRPYYLGFTTMGYLAEHDYTGKTGMNYEISERADYWSRGIESQLTAGYIFEGRGWAVMPYVGLGYSFWHLSGYHTQAADPSWNRHYDGESDGYLRAIAGVNFNKNWGNKDKRVYLAGRLGVEQALGDNDMAIVQSIPGLGSGKVKVEQEISNFSSVGNLELGCKIKDRYTVGLSLGSELNADYKAYTGQLLFRVAF